MPELPEVETIRVELAPDLEGRTVTAVRVHKSDIVLGTLGPVPFREALEGRRIERLGRRGKYLLFHLDDGTVVQAQLRMSGRFAVRRSASTDLAGYRHIAAEFDLDDGRTLYYDDVRRLGGFRVLSAPEWGEVETRLGPEPLSPTYRAADLAEALSGTRVPVKTALMDQRRLAGVGNIYASEVLHASRIDPRRPGATLDASEVRRLHRALRRVLGKAIRDAGTTFRSYRAPDGRAGRYQEKLRVYGREGRTCRRCRGEVRRIVQAGRSTFYCPGCQA